MPSKKLVINGSALAFFSQFFYFYSPPWLCSVPILVQVILPLVYTVAKKSEDKHPYKVLYYAVATSVLYFFCFYSCTVVDPKDEGIYQTGFYTIDYSLTDLGKLLKKKRPTDTRVQWMLASAAFVPDGPHKIWTHESIIFAGSILVLLFFLTSFFWCNVFIIVKDFEFEQKYPT